MVRQLAVSVPLAACLGLYGDVGAADPVQVTQWRPCVLSFEASRSHAWHAFPLRVSFTEADRGARLTLDGYWDGGRRWCVRFAAPTPGAWEYVTASADPSLDGRAGRIDVRPPTAEEIVANPNLRGQVRVVPGGRYFAYGDGTPFLGLAEQFWDFNVASWMPLDGVSVYLADRKGKGFNIVQVRYARVHVPNEGGFAFPDNTGPQPGNGDFERLNAEFFRALDRRMQACFEAGFVVAGHPLWIGYDTAISVADATLLQRYFLARYGAFNIIWSLSGEFDKAFNAHRGGEIRWRDEPHVRGIWNNGGAFDPDTDCEPWRLLGRAAAVHNPYSAPISVHPNVGMGGRRSSGDWLHDQPWLDHNWIQTYKAVHLVPERVQRDYRREPVKPVFFSEGIREGDQTEAIGVGAYGVRWEAWQAYLNGAAIHTYRHFGVYMDRWHTQGKCGPLAENLDANGATHAGVCAAFLRQLPWWRLVPAREHVRIDGEPVPFPRDDTRQELDRAAALAVVPGELCVLYVPKSSRAREITIDGLAPRTYAVRWLNPRNGQLRDLGEASPTADHPWTVPARPDNMDWVLLLRVSR